MTIAQPAHPSTRELRALTLAAERLEEIAASHRGGTYTVPASGGGTYTVRYTARDESCECKDWEFGHTCYHVLAAAVVRAKTGICAGCGRRFRHRELLEVGPESLTFFEGDVLCEGCALDHGEL
ncbi:MAG: SWIM zinc finger family protein [Actinomycetota bacterium]|nr:SWIM zinc finger family protein [Actinomycetota bacterium]